MRLHKNLLGMVLAVSLCLPMPTFAAKVHTQGCNECHRSSVNPRAMTNLCSPCHLSLDSTKASNAMGNHPTPRIGEPQSGDQTSHYWGGSTTTQPAAGATYPPTTFYTSRYSISKNIVTCTICHDPHVDRDVKPKLLRATAAGDLICQQCHTGFYVENPDALLTHPIGYPTLVNPTPTTYADAYAADLSNPKKFKAPGVVPNNAAQGITLINGYVSCSTCHAVHFADSDSVTPDGLLNAAGLKAGDGHLLKADGPTKTNKSVICQTCHTYQRHGNPASFEEDVGCLVCHSGHAYNGGTPNFFVLRNTLNTVTFGKKSNALYAPLTDAFLMNKGNGAGFCERCHGVSSAIPFHSLANGGTEDRYLQNCKDCHKHNEAGFDFSWKWSGNSNLCGDCHGFPPYLSVEGDYKDTGADVGTKGGYGVMDGGSDDSHTYFSSGYYKAEAGTPHKSHAGGGEALGAYIEATDYKFAEGQGACTLTCHDLNSHKQLDNTASFRNMVWGPIAKGNIAPNAVNLNPVYTTTGNGSCATVYCHSNGGTRPAGADRAKISTDFKFPTAAPVWATGDADIINAGTECSTFCHGNTATTMNSSNRNNSLSHAKHLNKGYACNVCHKLTSAVGSTTVVLNTARLAPTGTHVNGKPDVGFDITNDFDQGATGTQLNIIKPASGDAGSGYTAVTGVCYVYCHSDGKAIRTYTNVDWDQASTGACGTCHQYYSGAVPTGSGAALSATHAKHFAIAVALTCNDCHGTNASAGTHTGHVDTVFTMVVGSCNSCHGIDGAEAVPQWNAPMSNDYCISCHTGGSFGSIKTAMTAPNKQHAADRGHNRTTNYPSGNAAGNKLCTSCHLTNITNHVNVTDGDATHLVAAATNCTTTCHGVGGSAVGANTKGMVTHVGKTCTACHDPHGDTTLATNIYMVRSVSASNYVGAVDFRVKTGVNSYDEADAANGDDLCAACHTYGSGALSDHNTKTNQGIAHHEGEDCFTAGCHKSHKEAGGAFISSGGSGCNGCHGNPPATGAHRPTRGDRTLENDLTNPPRHSRTATHDETEDRTDCARCHTGAESYTFDPSLDRASAIAGRRNHGNTVAPYNRATVLAAAVNYGTSGNLTYCSTACHVSSATDGYWFDKSAGSGPSTWNKDAALNCNACHYYVVGATSSANNTSSAPRDLKGSHNAHFAVNKQKPCSSCHGAAPTDTTHVSVPLTGTDLQKIENRAAAVQNEADVLPAIATANDPGNETCSGAGVGLGCHNTKTTPPWTTTGITCTNCHNPAGSATADPKTGLHNIGVTEAAAGVQKHDSNLPGGGCTACHDSAKPSSHTDGIFLDDTAVRIDRFLTVKAGMFVDNATANRGTCSGTGNLTGCHSDSGNWTRLWSTEANSTAKNSGTARCNVCHGQYSTLTGSGGRGWNAGTSHYNTVGGATSLRGETHRSVVGENNACEDCHSYTTQGGGQAVPANHDTATHFLNVNNDAADIIVTESVEGWVYCAKCHTSGNPATAGTKTFPKSIFTRQLLAGANDPKQECNSCHGLGGNGRYWPVAAYSGADNDRGRHEIHMGRLAQARFYTAAATPTEAVTQLLADVNTKNNQIELCKYCHPGLPGQDTGHNNTVTNVSSAPTNYMHALWTDTTVNDTNATYTGTGANNTGTCANVNCHNEKNTTALASFTWHSTNESVVGTGTQNCLLCHNDVTAASGTGVTHSAHLAAKFGKAITCGSCHGGSPTWAPYAVATATAGNRHIDGAFKVGTASNAPITFSYTGVYTNQATRTLGTCATNLCHNNGAGGTPYSSGAALGAYNWQTALTDCTACHRNDSTLGSSHTPHLTAAVATFGKTLICVDCHEAGSATDMTAKANHINGAVTIASLAPMSTMTYSGAGTLNVVIGGGNTYGACTGSCHTNGKAAGTPAVTATWNTAQGANCTICHLAPNTAGNDGVRHSKHYNAHNNYVAAAKCGECHLGSTLIAYNSTNHFNGAVQTGNKILTHTAGTAGCTNSCHLVDTARGDWLDTAVLGCADCHVAGKIAATAGAMPTSGLHNITPRISAQKHDATLHANGCEVCHTTIRVATTTHIKGSYPADTTSNTDRGLFTPTYIDASGSCSGTAVNSASGCHQDNGKWGRKWSTTSQNNDGSECSNCHGGVGLGYVVTAWASGVGPDHTIDRNNDTFGNEVTTSNHSVCKTCHGFNSDADKDANYVDKHRDSNITMNLTTNYNDGNYGCDNAQCHLGGGAGLHGLADSGWTVQRVSFTTTGGACDQCHGYPPLPPGYVNGVGNYEKGKPENYPGGGSGHAIVKHLAKNILPANGWTPCSPCHYDDANNHDMGGNVTDRDGVDNIPDTIDDSIQVEIDPARDYKVRAIYKKGLPNSTDGMGQCKNLNCHFTESPKWDCSP